MHHYRGKLLDEDGVRLDPANVFIQYHHTHIQGDSEWYGYLQLKSDGEVDPGRVYTLRLEDGRAGRMRIGELKPDGSGGFRAVFVGEGGLN